MKSAKKPCCPGCEREIPALALWTALTLRAGLHCSACGLAASNERVLQLAESSPIAKTLVTALEHLIRFGWTSSDAIQREGVEIEPAVLGGVLTGLQRSGVIQKVGREPKLPILCLADAKHVFEPGPRFPKPSPELVASIRRRAPAVYAH